MSRGKAGSAGEGDRPREFGVLGAGFALDIYEKRTVNLKNASGEMSTLKMGYN